MLRSMGAASLPLHAARQITQQQQGCVACTLHPRRLPRCSLGLCLSKPWGCSPRLRLTVRRCSSNR